MPKYTIEDETGRQLTIEADSPPTPDEIEEVFQSALPTEQQYHEETRKIDKLQELSEGGPGAYALDMLRSLATGTGEGALGLGQAVGVLSPGSIERYRASNPTPEHTGASLLRGAGTMLPGVLPGLGAGGVAGSLMSKVPYARMLLTAPTEGAVGGGVSGYLAPYASEEEHVGNTTSGAISNAIGNSIFRLFGAGKNAIRSRVNPEAARELTLSLIRDKITPEAFEASLGKIRDFDNPLPTNHTVASIVGPDSYELSAIQNAVEQKMAPEFAKLYDQNESVRRGLLQSLRTPQSSIDQLSQLPEQTQKALVLDILRSKEPNLSQLAERVGAAQETPTRQTVSSILQGDSYPLAAVEHGVRSYDPVPFIQQEQANNVVRRSMLEELRTPGNILETLKQDKRDIIGAASKEFLDAVPKELGNSISEMRLLDRRLAALEAKELPDSPTRYAIIFARRNLEVQAKEAEIASRLRKAELLGDDAEALKPYIRDQVYREDKIPWSQRALDMRKYLNSIRSGEPIEGKSLKEIDAAIQSTVMPELTASIERSGMGRAFNTYREMESEAMALLDTPMATNKIVDLALSGENINPTTLRNAVAEHGEDFFGDLLGDSRARLAGIERDIRAENFPSAVMQGATGKVVSPVELDATGSTLQNRMLERLPKSQRYAIASELLRNPRNFSDEVLFDRAQREVNSTFPYTAKEQVLQDKLDNYSATNDVIDKVFRGERINPTTLNNAIEESAASLGAGRKPLELILQDVRRENFPSSIRAGMDSKLASHTEDAERAALHASQIGNHTLVAANVLRGWGEKERYRIASELLRNPKKYLEESEKYLAKLMGKNSVRDRASMLRGELATNNAILEGREK